MPSSSERVSARSGSTSGAAPSIIDYWCNAFTPDREERWAAALRAQGVPLKVRGGDDDSFTTPDRMVGRLDSLQIATVIIPVGDIHDLDDVCDFGLVASMRPHEFETLREAHPDRFAAMWSIDPRRGRRAVRAAAEQLARGAVALHIHTHSFDLPFDDRAYYPFYELAAEHQVPVVMQAGTSGGLAPSACGQPIGIDRPAIYFDDVRFVLSHLGWPWVNEAIAMTLKFPNIYLGTAVYPARHWAADAVGFLRGPGRRKMLYGSGFPAAGHRHTLDQVGELGLDADTAAAYLGGTARQLFTRLPEGPAPP